MNASAIVSATVPKRPQVDGGWGKPRMSTYYHYFVPQADDASGIRRSICGLSRYAGEVNPAIVRWEVDPAICEICRDILRARAQGRIALGEPTRLIAIVPPGLPDRIREVFAQKPKSGDTTPPFFQALTQFRDEGVTRPFLAALLRYDKQRAGKHPRLPALGWRDIHLDEIRETTGVERVRLEREPIWRAE